MSMPATTSIACILLAAGGGSRMGGGKLLLPWRNKPLVAHVLETALHGFDFLSITVVLGHEGARLRQELGAYAAASSAPLHFVDNPAWRQGQSSSLRCGLSSLCAAPETSHVQSAMVLLGDQPLVRAHTLHALIRAHRLALRAQADHPATVPVFQGKRGNPVILSRSLFPEICALQGDTGARPVLRALGSAVLRLPVDDPGVLHDVDTPEAYSSLCRQYAG